MMTDTRIIARQGPGAGALQVLAQRHEVMWRDGTSVTLHPIQAHGLPMAMLRAVALPCGQLLLVDLAKLVARLGAELPATPARDVPGLVFFTLRQTYGSAPAFIADAQRKAGGSWWRQPMATPGWLQRGPWMPSCWPPLPWPPAPPPGLANGPAHDGPPAFRRHRHAAG